MELNKKIVLIAAGSLLSVGGLYAASANDATPVAPVITSPTVGVDSAEVGDTDNLQEGDQNGVDDATEGVTENVSDGVDVGSDMNASESGHDDADEADDADDADDVDDVNEAPDATEVDGD